MQAGIVMKAYAAKAYTYRNPRTSKYVEVNVPDLFPTIPKDAETTTTMIPANYTANTNYPSYTRVVTTSHSLKLPLLSGTSCPTVFSKGTPFILLCPTAKVEEGYLIHI